MLNKIKKIDWIILIILAGLMVISYFAVKSATANSVLYAGFEKKQMIFYAIGFVLVICTTFIDYRILLKTWWVWYIIGVASLILIFPFGSKINGATGWFKLFGDTLSIQPAEIVKLFLIIGIAYLMGRRQGEQLRFRKDIIPIGLYAFVPFLLVMLQPDLGNAIIYVVIVIGMLWIGNVRYLHVLIGVLACAAAIALFLFVFNTFNTEIKDYLISHDKVHWYDRINTFLNPDEASADDKFQSENAMQAIGSGGLSGQGYMNGNMKNGGFIPYPYSDSVFVVIGEEFGFEGAAILLLLYFLLIYRMVIVSFICADRRAAYMIIGIVSMFVFQIFQNIGMMIGLMPITGITLPFISYGGTSLLLNMLCIGLVFSIRANQHTYEVPD